jgi:tetrahydromethanopterin S-methyltransferase subunit A
MNNLENVIGELCRKLLHIPEELFIGNPNSSFAICTLSSMELLEQISNSELLQNISIAGRLLSENKGIDSIIKYVNQNKKIKTIIICGKEIKGHKPGHSLLELHKNGIDQKGRIICSTSPNPFLTVSKSEVSYFQNQINIINLINETNLNTIKKYTS